MISLNSILSSNMFVIPDLVIYFQLVQLVNLYIVPKFHRSIHNKIILHYFCIECAFRFL